MIPETTGYPYILNLFLDVFIERVSTLMPEKKTVLQHASGKFYYKKTIRFLNKYQISDGLREGKLFLLTMRIVFDTDIDGFQAL